MRRLSALLAAGGLLLASVHGFAADDPARVAAEAGSRDAMRPAGDGDGSDAPLVRIAVDGPVLFVGAVSAENGSSLVLEMSEDLVQWEASLPRLDEAAPPPPPPIVLVEELVQRGGLQLRILPLRIAEWGQLFFRSLAFTEAAAPGRGQPVED